MRLPNYNIPYEEENCFSWIERLAQMNGFKRQADLLHYFCEEPYATEKSRYAVEKYRFDMMKHPERFVKLTSAFENPLEMLSKLSLFPLYYPFLLSDMQDRYIHSLFNDCQTLMPTNNSTLIPELHYCPLCHAEDVKNRRMPYLRRIHLVPGITVCPKHKIPLKVYDTDEDITSSLVPLSAQLAYAAFAQSLLNDWVVASIHDVGIAIQKRLNELGYTVKDPRLVSGLKNTGLAGYFERDITLTIIRCRDAKTQINIKHMLALCTFLFGDSKILRQYINRPKVDEPGILNQIRKMGYEPCGEFNEILMRFEHVECTTRFYASPRALLRGFGCSLCDCLLSEKELFQRIVRYTDDSAYELLSEYDGPTRHVILRHRPCGREFFVRANDFLFRDIRCTCRYETEQSAAEKVKSKGNYKLLSYDEKAGVAVILAKDCNHEFSVNLRDFMNWGGCRICQSDMDRHYTSDGFKSDIRDLVGEEYELLSPYVKRTEKVTMRHVGCGHVFDVTPQQFLHGARCPKCVNRLSLDEYTLIIAIESGGRYEVMGQEKTNYLRLLDTVTNEEIVIGQREALQELRRPTPSEVLPKSTTHRL